MLTTLLVLADGRLPSGAHAHSGGLEPAVAAARVADLADLDGFLRGRLATAGLVTAAFAAAACASAALLTGPGALARLDVLDAELDARTPSPAQRKASRQQGRALLRAGRAMWPLPAVSWPATGPHQPIALGVITAAAGLDPSHAATTAAYGTISGPASAAVRLLGLDPYRVHALLAALAVDCDRVADRAAAYAKQDPENLPAASAPLLDIGAEVHASWEVRLFAS
ncbi:urease accessory protein UreF [Luedemannella helvata]|uniref:Urease accessory protein UreF n=1 Tax=Luedemannella helvata TaxID=349315 RepID=A0ABP4WHP3_9ACTN